MIYAFFVFGGLLIGLATELGVKNLALILCGLIMWTIGAALSFGKMP